MSRELNRDKPISEFIIHPHNNRFHRFFSFENWAILMNNSCEVQCFKRF